MKKIKIHNSNISEKYKIMLIVIAIVYLMNWIIEWFLYSYGDHVTFVARSDRYYGQIILARTWPYWRESSVY